MSTFAPPFAFNSCIMGAQGEYYQSYQGNALPASLKQVTDEESMFMSAFLPVGTSEYAFDTKLSYKGETQFYDIRSDVTSLYVAV
jgi:hypothetical protein